MSTSVVRANDRTNALLDELVKQTGETKTNLLAQAVEALYQQRFWERANQAYAEAGATSVEESEAWASALGDGLEKA